MVDEPKKEFMEIDGEQIALWYFSVPMFHVDWHIAEKLGIEYVYTTSDGGDYWDNDMVFTKPENYDKVAANNSP